MRILLLMLGLQLMSQLISAQKNGANGQEMETLFNRETLTVGGFGGPRVAYTLFHGKGTWLTGGVGAALFNHTFFIGGGGFGISNSPHFTNVNGHPNAYFNGGYGGVLLGVIVNPHKLVHLTFPVLIGAGSVFYSETSLIDHPHRSRVPIIDQSEFFVIEPGVEIELNVVRFMRVAAGITYRITSGLDLIDTPSSAFKGLSGAITFKFGRF